jgi:hypothetical protein
MSHENKNVVAALADLCRELGVKTLIQVGSGDGYESYTVAKETGCRAIAIDGNRGTVAVSPDLEFHNIVIGSSDCHTVFYEHSNKELSSQIPRGANEFSVVTPLQRLDTFCGVRCGLRPDGLIIDTEGTTMDVLEGCGDLLDEMKIVYAECQTSETRPGIRLLSEVDSLLVARGMTQHEGPPSYTVGPQGNYTWIRR